MCTLHLCASMHTLLGCRLPIIFCKRGSTLPCHHDHKACFIKQKNNPKPSVRHPSFGSCLTFVAISYVACADMDVIHRKLNLGMCSDESSGLTPQYRGHAWVCCCNLWEGAYIHVAIRKANVISDFGTVSTIQLSIPFQNPHTS